MKAFWVFILHSLYYKDNEGCCPVSLKHTGVAPLFFIICDYKIDVIFYKIYGYKTNEGNKNNFYRKDVKMSIFSRLFGKSTNNIPSVCTVDIKRYAGTWYEIARLPNNFEKGLKNVTATYNIQSDEKIEVINSGVKNGKKKVARGVAWLRNKNCTGELFVSFFWIFKSEYNIIRLDEKNYSFAVVTSSTMNYLWILSKTPKISNELYNDLISYAASKGFDVSKIE